MVNGLGLNVSNLVTVASRSKGRHLFDSNLATVGAAPP